MPFAPEQNWVLVAEDGEAALQEWRSRCATSGRPDTAEPMSCAPLGIRLMARAEAAVGASSDRRAEIVSRRTDARLARHAPDPSDQLHSESASAIICSRVGSGWTICFEAEETKTRGHLELPFPEELVGKLERYLAYWRRVSCSGATSSDRLWISRRSSPFGKVRGVRLADPADDREVSRRDGYGRISA